MNLFKQALCITSVITALLFARPVFAGGIPVIDTVAIGHAITELNEMAKDYQNQMEQLEQALATHNSITGSRNIGDLLNSSAQQDLRRALPDNLQDMIGLNNAPNLGNAGSNTQSIYNNLLSAYNPITGAELFASNPTSDLASAHNRHSQTTTAALAASESSFNNASQRLAGYESLLTELNNSPDLKTSVDLLSRITVENGLLMNELMRIQALQMQLNASAEGRILTDKRRTNDARKYDSQQAVQSFQIQAP
jgi:hypothetical protein